MGMWTPDKAEIDNPSFMPTSSPFPTQMPSSAAT
eukprot:gene698-604_t